MASQSTASTIVAKTVPASHDVTIRGYSATKDCYSHGTYIKSASFDAGGRRWYLRYYPNGCCLRDVGYVTFLLYQDDRDNGQQKVPVGLRYHISLLGREGNPVGCKSEHRLTDVEPSDHASSGLIRPIDLELSGYLRGDAFAVRCEFSVPMIVTETVQNKDEEPSNPPTTHVPADVHEGLIRVFSDKVPTDVALEVGDETFRAHRRFLAAQSPVLAALFTGPMRENTAPSVRIDAMEPRVFEAMLHFIYRGNLPVVDESDSIAMTQHLLVAADRYDLERLKSICAEKLRGHINTTTVATTLELAHRHGCHALKDACYDFLAPPRGNLKAILKSEGFEQLIVDYPSVVVELLARVGPPHP